MVVDDPAICSYKRAIARGVGGLDGGERRGIANGGKMAFDDQPPVVPLHQPPRRTKALVGAAGHAIRHSIVQLEESEVQLRHHQIFIIAAVADERELPRPVEPDVRQQLS